MQNLLGLVDHKKKQSVLKGSILVVLLFIHFTLVAQQPLLRVPTDTIDINYRSNGLELDSIDAGFIGTLSLRPGAGDRRLAEFDLAQVFYDQMNGLGYRMNAVKVQPKWTGLPYLGFQYAFGSRLNQAMNVQYHHYLSPTTHLHFQYHRRTSNGFLRNSDFTMNDVSLFFGHSKGRFSTEIDAYYGADELGQYEGIISDSLISVFPLEFIQVQNQSARSRVRQLDVNWNNYYRLIGDSVVGTGLISRHNYELSGREYTSAISDPTAFDTLYIDSFSTRDQYQTASISNGVGVYLSSRTFSFDAALNQRYWRNQNLGVNRDTIEAFLDANTILNIGEDLRLSSYFYLNFLGAIGELKSKTNLQYHFSEKLAVDAGLNFMNTYPIPYLRFHSANNFQWSVSSNELEMQQTLQLRGSIKYGDKNKVIAAVNWTTINNGRYFIENEWRQDTLDIIAIGDLAIKGELKAGGWSFYPGFTLRFQSSNFNYQPLFSSLNRITYQTKIFNNNLGWAIGADVGYDQGYRHLNYNGVLGVYSPSTGLEETPSLFRLNAFTSISIDQFRLFVRAENIDYFINDPTSRIDLQVPLMPFLLRVGVTWDFFN